MSVFSVEYYGLPGTTDIVDPALAYVTMLRVKRNGVAFTVIIDESNPDLSGLRRVNYTVEAGRLHFGDAFIENDTPLDSLNEKVHVMYKV